MSFLGRLFGRELPGRPDLDAVAPGDRVSADGEEWTVRAIVHYRIGDVEWPRSSSSGATPRRGSATRTTRWSATIPGPTCISPRTGRSRGVAGCTVEDAGTATVSRVTGPVDVAPGDRVRYDTLTSPDDTEGWLSVESWDSGYVEISIGRPR